jgi:hypothetical protein
MVWYKHQCYRSFMTSYEQFVIVQLYTQTHQSVHTLHKVHQLIKPQFRWTHFLQLIQYSKLSPWLSSSPPFHLSFIHISRTSRGLYPF